MDSKYLSSLSDAIITAEFELQTASKEYNKWLKSDDATLDKLASIYGQLRVMGNKLDDFKKEFNELESKISEVDLIAFFKVHGTTRISNEYGTVYLTSRFSTSIQDKEKAFEWLKENELGDLIQPAVNASTLKAALSRFVDETGKEPDPDVIKVSRYTMAAFKGK